MTIHVRACSDPLSDNSFEKTPESDVIVAQSDASRILVQELKRYCNGQLQGRSFLIAGHRGSGKTTMVAHALQHVMSLQASHSVQRQPLPIFLHGPSLFEEKAQAKSGGDSAPAPLVLFAAASDAPKKEKKAQAPDDEQASFALMQIILGLHRAAMRRFVVAYRERMKDVDYRALGLSSPAERDEIAAQFEIEILEDPPASRLREFWAMAGALESGVLNDGRRKSGQGARELVALNGLCNAHQRISGEISQTESDKTSDESERTRSGGFDFRTLEALKPYTAVFAGATVAGGVAVGTASAPAATILGLVAAFASSFFLKSTSTTSTKRSRSIDKTFIPDLSVRTLDRVLPTILLRLRDAGLAPIFVIDELDKVKSLAPRMERVIGHLKKLMAESVFSCFLTDRGYHEYLRADVNRRAYSVTYSYFSHPLLVAYEPADFDRYMQALFYLQQPNDPTLSEEQAKANAARDALDYELLRWVLRHRAQLHALALQREIARLRSDGDELDVEPGVPTTDPLFKIDATFQVAIELLLFDPAVARWMRQRPGMQQTMIDALYHVSRRWAAAQPSVDLSDGAKSAFGDELKARMNLAEVEEPPAPGAAAVARDELADDDLDMLIGTARRLAAALADAADAADMARRWTASGADLAAGAVAPRQEVFDSLLLGSRSLLVRDAQSPDKYFFRYFPSGELRYAEAPPAPPQQPAGADAPEGGGGPGAPAAPQAAPPEAPAEISAANLQQIAEQKIGYIIEVERKLWSVLRPAPDAALTLGSAYTLLADLHRVLPGTPAWTRVRGAMAVIESAKTGSAGEAQVKAAATILGEFEQMLAANLGVVPLVLAYAAFVGGTADCQDVGTAVRDGLAVLSEGLSFANLDAARIRDRLRELRGELEKRYGSAVPEPATQSDYIVESELIRITEEAFKAGAAFSRGKPTAALLSHGWDELRERLLIYAQRGTAEPARLHEILCAARKTGPATVALAIHDQRLDVWTRALVRFVAPESSEPPPYWVPLFALRFLGIASIGVEPARKVLDALCRRIPTAHQEAARALAFGRSLWMGEPSVARTLIVVRSSGPSSITEHWTRTPTQALVLVLTARALETLLSRADLRIQDLLPEPYIVAWEQPADIGIDHEQHLRTVLKKLADVKDAWIYQRPASSNNAPAAINPRGPDEVILSVVPHLQRPSADDKA